MLRLFAIKNTLFDDDAEFEKNLALIDGERRQKVNSLTLREKKNECLAAGIILPLALKACGYSGEVRIEKGEWNKPVLVQPKNLFFNLSHSGEWTVIALSGKEVGVDVQQIKPADMRLARRFFTREEAKAIENAPDPDKLFYRIWTAKEAYLKAIGTGLNRPLNSIDVHVGESVITVTDPQLG
ncbi:MAG: 4'-phosphopantetheinyl transferase superfamily protein, partial [Clostridia bacterium]|nr:4'-phosphopantetheinyl transferase superfamily protein [Clostridia bacterium]